MMGAIRGRAGTRAVLLVTAVLHLPLLAGEAIAPNPPDRQHRWLPYAAPTRLHVVDAEGRLHLRPFVYPVVEARPGVTVEDRTRPAPLRLLPRCEPYRLWGLVRLERRLVGVDPPAVLLPLGADAYGRDVLARLLVGGRLSVGAGLLAAGLAVGLGSLIGAAAGLTGGLAGAAVSRLTELFLALPWLYLLLGARALLPLSISPTGAFLLVVVLIGAVGWPRPAHLVQATVRAARSAGWVDAARGFGASRGYLLRRHLLPAAAPVVLTQAALLVPQYVLAEVALSFLGLGVTEPAASWGNMLTEAQRLHVLTAAPWLLSPAAALLALNLCYHRLAALADAPGRRAKST